MGVWSQGPENMCLKCFTNAARLCRLRPPTPGAWAGPLSWFILRATPASLTKCHGLRCLRVSLKEATGQEFLAFSVLEHLHSVLVLSTQASKPKSNITILGGKKKNLQQCLPQISPNAKKNQQISSSQACGLEETHFLVSCSEYQPPAFLLRNCCSFWNNHVNKFE